MMPLFERLAALMTAPPPAEGGPDFELCRLLAALTPDDVRANVLVHDQLSLIQMIREHVPGYGPH